MDGRRRDPGCFARTTLMRALRHVARQDDIGLVERAVMTYEFMPPFTGQTGSEVATGLRSVALVTLNEIDETLAGYHGVRLLVDQYPAPMPGEPAMTAARVLAAQGHLLPLSARVLHADPGVPDVVGECLCQLTALPASLKRLSGSIQPLVFTPGTGTSRVAPAASARPIRPRFAPNCCAPCLRTISVATPPRP